jgi:hypothetical protein
VLWRETLHVLMTPDRLDYRILPPLGLTPTDIGSVPCLPSKPSDPSWKAACNALADLIDKREPGPLRIEVLLSDRFVRYQILEWRPGVATRAEWRAYAMHGFTAVHGDTAKDWQFRIDLVPPGRPSLACAIDNTLVETLRDLSSKRASRLVGVRPQFVKLFNRKHFSAHHKEQIWFAVVEDCHLCLGVQAGKTWRVLRNEAAPDGWLSALPGMIRRICSSLDMVQDGTLHLCGDIAPGTVPASIEGLPVHAVETGFLRGCSVAALES